MNIKETLQVAQQLMSQNKLEQADSMYCSVLEQHPNHLGVQLQRGKILRLQGKSEKALIYFKNILDIHLNQPPALLELANELRDQHHYIAAEEYYHRIPETVPRYFDALVGLGISARLQAQRELALSYFQKAAALRPGNIHILLQVAAELRELNRMAESDALYQTLLKQGADNFTVLLGLALNARKKGDRKVALSLFRQQAVVQPDNPQTQLNIATELRELARFAEAGTIYQNLLIKKPNNFEVLYGQAINSRKRGERQAALSQFQTLHQLYPERHQPTLEVAIELRDLGQFDEALVLLQSAEQQFPENFTVPLQQGFVYRQLLDHEKALMAFQKSSAIQPFNLQNKLNIATEYFILGKVSSAIESVTQILQQDPQHLGALLQLGNWLMDARTFAEAQHYFLQALELYPQQVQPYILSAQAFIELGEQSKCFAMLDKATDVVGKNPEVYYKKILLLWLTRQFESALAIQAEAICLFPEHYSLQLQQIDFQTQRGQYKEALENIALLATNTVTQQLKVRVLKAQINKDQWRLIEALQQYQMILKNYPHCSEARRGVLLISLISMDIKAAREQAYILGQLNLGRQKVNGRNRSYLHSHDAQLMDECEINHPVLQCLQAALNLPLTRRLQAVAEIVIEDPETTSGAVTLLVQLQQAGYFELIKSNDDPIIPRNIFQYWDRPNPPEEVLSFTQSWQRHHPDYDYQLLDEEKAQRFLQQNYPQRVLNSYLCCKHAAQRADVLRLTLLSCYGGIYADADDYCLQSLDKIFSGGTQLVLWHESKGTVGNNFIAVTANHPVITYALEHAIDAMERGDNDSIWLSTGPGLISRSLANYLAAQWPKKTPQDLGVMVLTRAKLMNFVGIQGKLAYKSTEDSWLIKEFSQGNRIELKGLIPTKANNV